VRAQCVTTAACEGFVRPHHAKCDERSFEVQAVQAGTVATCGLQFTSTVTRFPSFAGTRNADEHGATAQYPAGGGGSPMSAHTWLSDQITVAHNIAHLAVFSSPRI